jgi:Rhodopirellula transposase DDE domain
MLCWRTSKIGMCFWHSALSMVARGAKEENLCNGCLNKSQIESNQDFPLRTSFDQSHTIQWPTTPPTVSYPFSKHTVGVARLGIGGGVLQCERHQGVSGGAVRKLSSRPADHIEHRLFSHISLNWQGEPLKDYETMLNFIRNTTTETGLRCQAVLDSRLYPTKVKITAEQKQQIRIRKSKVLPQWNYTICTF